MHRPKAPPHVGPILEPYKDLGIHVRAKAYTARESRRYLKDNLLKRGLQPLQLTIHNNTRSGLYLSSDSLDIENLSAATVANWACLPSIPRAIGLKVAALFFWPFCIPATIDSIVTFRHYGELRRDYAAKSLKKEREILLPYSTTHRVVFVKADRLQGDLTLYLREVHTGRVYPISTKMELS